MTLRRTVYTIGGGRRGLSAIVKILESFERRNKMFSKVARYLFSALLLFPQISLAQSETLPTPGRYEGVMKDGSTFRVVLIPENNSIRVKEAGYSFVQQISVDRICTKDDKLFGKLIGDKITFHVPIFSVNLTRGYAPTISYYYKVELEKNKAGLNCTLTRIDTLDKEYSADFTAENLRLEGGLGGWGGSDGHLDDNYVFTLLKLTK
ncbi:MAG: hypothetical protein AB7D05_05975 [Mangrovibacterium sp.]